MKLKKIKQDIIRFAGNYILLSGLDILCKSLKITFINQSSYKKLEEKDQNYVLAFWHGTMLIPWFLNKGKNFAALISKSKDGDLLSKVLKEWDYSVVRGSSSMGGEIALNILIDFARNKKNIAITPDGPRGPEHKLKAGAVITAKKTGIPLVLLGIGFRKKRVLKSWDKFEIPRFFTEVKVVYSEPIYIDKNLNYDETSGMINMCENKLNELQLEAGKF